MSGLLFLLAIQSALDLEPLWRHTDSAPVLSETWPLTGTADRCALRVAALTRLAVAIDSARNYRLFGW